MPIRTSSSWDFKCIGLDNQLLPLSGITAWHSDHSLSTLPDWHIYGPPEHAPPNKPLPPLPIEHLTSEDIASLSFESVSDGVGSFDYEAAWKVLDEHPLGSAGASERSVVPMLEGGQGRTGSGERREKEMVGIAQRFTGGTGITDGSGSIVVGLDASLVGRSAKMSKASLLCRSQGQERRRTGNGGASPAYESLSGKRQPQGSVLLPWTYESIPEAYDEDCLPCDDQEGDSRARYATMVRGDGYSHSTSGDDLAGRKLTVKREQSKKPGLSRRKTGLRVIDDDGGGEVVYVVPGKAARVLGLGGGGFKKRMLPFRRGI